jgi:uncharacterized membrane protein YgcG
MFLVQRKTSLEKINPIILIPLHKTVVITIEAKGKMISSHSWPKLGNRSADNGVIILVAKLKEKNSD